MNWELYLFSSRFDSLRKSEVQNVEFFEACDDGIFAIILKKKSGCAKSSSWINDINHVFGISFSPCQNYKSRRNHHGSNMMANYSNIIPFNKQLRKDILMSPAMLYVTIIAHLFIIGANDRYHLLKQTNTSFERWFRHLMPAGFISNSSRRLSVLESTRCEEPLRRLWKSDFCWKLNLDNVKIPSALL